MANQRNLSVRASLSNFPSEAELPDYASLDFGASDLARALFVTGRAPGAEFTYVLGSFWEFMHRAALIPAYLRRDSGSRVVRSVLALELDRSEKVNLSYSLGQAMATVFCERQLGVSRMLHVDRYQAHHGVRFGPGRRRPDLFGLGHGGWVVTEAKGRSNGVDSDLLAKAKAQTSMVKTVEGKTPWLKTAVVAAFPPPSGVMTVTACDPPETVSKAEDWPVTNDEFVSAYYAPFLRTLEIGQASTVRSSGGSLYRIVDLGPIGLRIGLLDELVRVVDTPNLTGLAGRADDVINSAGEGLPFSDGSYFDASWDDSLAQQDWK